MSEANKAVVMRAFDECWNDRNLDACDTVFAHDFVTHDPFAANFPDGPAGMKARIGFFTSAFPDLKMTCDELLAEGDRVVVRWTGRGTHGGSLMGLPPTGRPVTVSGILIQRVEGGRIAESWGVVDRAAMMEQIAPKP